jgi:hypothetical protein
MQLRITALGRPVDPILDGFTELPWTSVAYGRGDVVTQPEGLVATKA